MVWFHTSLKQRKMSNNYLECYLYCNLSLPHKDHSQINFSFDQDKFKTDIYVLKKKRRNFPNRGQGKQNSHVFGGTFALMDSGEYIKKSKVNPILKMSPRFSKAPIILLSLLFKAQRPPNFIWKSGTQHDMVQHRTPNQRCQAQTWHRFTCTWFHKCWKTCQIPQSHAALSIHL